MLRYLILVGALAAMPLSGFAAMERGEPAANVQQQKSEGPVWVVEATKNLPNQGPVWVVIKSKGLRTMS